MNRKQKLLDENGLLDYAVRLLGGRGQSLGEIRQRLRVRAAVLGHVETVLRRLKEMGYLDDQRFAENFAASRLAGQGLGKMRVLRDLRRRRIAPGLAEKVVREAYGETDEVALVEAWLGRKYRGKKLAEWLGDDKNLASTYRRLRTAGFSHANSTMVLKRYAKRAEVLDDIAESGELS